MYKNFFKRLIDIILSFLGLVVLFIPMVIIGIIIKIDSKGPVIFKTKRVGKNNKPFKFYKFRSMKTTAPKDCAPMLLDSEEYITKVGSFLRKTSLDELPQLICILKGDMSIIGPRPSGFSETILIEERDKNGASKLTPGLTGLAQVSGRDVLASNIVLKAKYDGMYADKITFFGDLKIFFRTIFKVVERDGIVEGTEVLAKSNIQTAETISVPVLEEIAVTTVPIEKTEVIGTTALAKNASIITELEQEKVEETSIQIGKVVETQEQPLKSNKVAHTA